MNITLISLTSDDIGAFGIRTISSCLKKEGHNVRLIFLRKLSMEKYDQKSLEKICSLSEGSDLIGLSLTTNYFSHAVQVTSEIKKNLNTKVVWGGIHPTIRPEECLEHADIVGLGEADESIVVLARAIENGLDNLNIKNFWFKDKNGNIIKNQLSPPVSDIDTIPFQDYETINDYVYHQDDIVKLDMNLLQKILGPTYVTLSSRGCPFGCTYCCNSFLNKLYKKGGMSRLVRRRSLTSSVIKELVEIKKKLPFIKRILFDDDAFFFYSIQEIEEFCDLYKKLIGLPLLVSGLNPTQANREKLALLTDAGLIGLRMGIQSASPKAKELYKRNYSNETILKAAQIINEFTDDISELTYDIILDNPWEDEDDLYVTLKFLTTLPLPYNLMFFSLTFYPETDLYFRAKKEGIIKDDSKDDYSKHTRQCRNTYYNRLFFLLKGYSRRGKMISESTLGILTNKKLRKLSLNWPLLYIYSLPYALWFVRRGFKAVLRWDTKIISLYFMEKKDFKPGSP